MGYFLIAGLKSTNLIYSIKLGVFLKLDVLYVPNKLELYEICEFFMIMDLYNRNLVIDISKCIEHFLDSAF